MAASNVGYMARNSGTCKICRRAILKMGGKWEHYGARLGHEAKPK